MPLEMEARALLAEEQVAHLEEELGRRYRELESMKARCAELEQELDYQMDDCRDLRRQRDQLMIELGDAVQSRLHAERRADEAERRASSVHPRDLY